MMICLGVGVGVGFLSEDLELGPPDVTAPVLSAPTDAANGQFASTGSVITDESGGSLYWVVTTSVTSPSAAQVKLGQDHLGAAAAQSGQQLVSTTGVQNIAPSGLDENTAYFTHYMQQDLSANQSNVATASGFTTANAAPTLSSPIDAADGSDAADASVDTDEANGTLYWVITQSSTTPSAAQIKLGQDHLGAGADADGSQAVSATGTQNVSPTGLSEGVGYFTHFMHEDAVGNQSTPVSASGFTTAVVAPVLSSPIDAANGDTASTGSVTTDEGNGTLYWVVTQSSTSPSKAQVKAGQDHTGAAADASGSQAVSGTGSQAIAPSGLSASTGYVTHFMHEDAVGGQSNVATASGFTTDAASGSPWVPSDGTNTQLWLNQDDDGGAETNRSVRTDSGTDFLTDLYDQIGTDNFSQSTASQQPIIAGTGSQDDDNGNDVGIGAATDVLSGTNTSWGTTTLSNGSGDRWTIAFAAKFVSGRPARVAPFGIHNNLDAVRLALEIEDDGDIKICAGGFPTAQITGAITDDTWHVIALYFDGSTIDCRVDGVYVGQHATPGTNDADVLRIFARKSGASSNQHMGGSLLSDFIVSDAAYAFTSGDEGEKIEGYLGHKVGATLDSGHTYFASAP